jgi:hypothetical protein
MSLSPVQTNICIIGNSHVACVKMAWDRIGKEHPDIALSFFAARGNHLAALAVQERMLVATTDATRQMLRHTSGGRDHIDFAAYDHCLICAAGFSFPYHLQTARHYSKAVQTQCLQDLFQGSLLYRLARDIRRLTAIPLWLGHEPLLALAERTEQEFCFSYADFLQQIRQLLPATEMHILPQAAETIAEGCFTHPRFSVGSRRLDIGDEISGDLHPANDRAHMNEAYGEALLNHLFQGIRR